MRFGINTFLFGFPFTNQSTQLFPQFRSWGFDSVELPLGSFDDFSAPLVRDELSRHELSCCAVTPCLGPGQDLRGTPEEQKAGLEFMQGVIDRMVDLECPVLSGVVYSVVGRAEAYPPAEKERQWITVVGNLRRLADYAEARGRTIALEVINRFETDLINTCAQGLSLVRAVGSPALKLHLDTFHMNIEEKDPAAAIRLAGAELAHFHACGCDRGTPGRDHIDWKPIARALQAVHYDGAVVIESFSSAIPAIARAASVWRPLASTQDEIASEGVQFLRALFT